MPFTRWSSSRNFHFAPDGKHVLKFPEDCPLLVYFSEFDIDYRLTPSYHDHFEISYVYEGVGKFTATDRIYDVGPGDVLLMGSQEFHRLEVSLSQRMRTISIFFLPELVHNAGTQSLDFEYLAPFYQLGKISSHKVPAMALKDHSLLPFLEKLHEVAGGKETYDPLAVKTYLTDILFILARCYHHSASDHKLHAKSISDVNRLQNVLVFLQNNYGSKISLKQAAAVACISPDYFCKLFRKVTGHTFTDYVLRLRIDRARELLLSSDLSITQIALEVGFESHSYFDRMFRRLARLSPQDYRQRFEQPVLQPPLPTSQANGT